MNYLVIVHWGPDAQGTPNPYRKVAKFQGFDTQQEADDFRVSILGDYPNAFVVANPVVTGDFAQDYRVNVSGDGLELKTQAEQDAIDAEQDAEIDALVDQVTSDRKTTHAAILCLFELINDLRADPTTVKSSLTVAQLKTNIKAKRATL